MRATANLNWKPLLRQIKEDPDEWLESGGWEFLNNEIDDDEEIEGEGAESESDFEPSESEEESDFDESAVNHWSNQKMTTRVILIMTMKAWNGTSWRRRLRLLMKMLQIAKI